ncbi:hypothetical protein [Rhodococcus rhodochrous]|uniref:hypothetical protein n=1 Tax=Rhodococcus rhodochrous TaxID=1829 RepID=UPI0017822171|nr:hypothetical protein [Rhodococcus rhodochrous]
MMISPIDRLDMLIEEAFRIRDLGLGLVSAAELLVFEAEKLRPQLDPPSRRELGGA